MNKKNKLIFYNNDFLVGCQNLDQLLQWFAIRYKRLSKIKRDNLKARYENTYMTKIIEQLDDEIKKAKPIKKYNILSDNLKDDKN